MSDRSISAGPPAGRTQEGIGSEPLPVLLAALHAECFPPAGRWDATAMDQLLRMPGAAASVLPCTGEPAGLALWRVAADEAELLTLGVRPDARGRGLGRALLRHAAADAAAAGATRMVLEVAVGNAAAMALYRGAGFHGLGCRRAYYPDGTDAAVLGVALPLP